MKYAIIEGERFEPQPGTTGKCPCCERDVISKCGEKNIWHWAHKGKRMCDPWWENETEWHRTSKNNFPVDWQEIVQFSETGEKHIADVKTPTGWVIEFQHSFLKPEERRSRDEFYKKLIWVVDGRRRLRDPILFETDVLSSPPIFEKPFYVQRTSVGGNKLVHEWSTSRAPVFFDLWHPQFMWLMLPIYDDGFAYFVTLSRQSFVNVLSAQPQVGVGDFGSYLKNLCEIPKIYNDNLRLKSQAEAKRQDWILGRRMSHLR
jgi:competence protein CoiA